MTIRTRRAAAGMMLIAAFFHCNVAQGYTRSEIVGKVTILKKCDGGSKICVEVSASKIRTEGQDFEWKHVGDGLGGLKAYYALKAVGPGWSGTHLQDEDTITVTFGDGTAVAAGFFDLQRRGYRLSTDPRGNGLLRILDGGSLSLGFEETVKAVVAVVLGDKKVQGKVEGKAFEDLSRFLDSSMGSNVMVVTAERLDTLKKKHQESASSGSATQSPIQTSGSDR